MAGVTGLEPATSGVTGRRSNQLSYAPAGGARCNSAQARSIKGGARASQGRDLGGSLRTDAPDALASRSHRNRQGPGEHGGR